MRKFLLICMFIVLLSALVSACAPSQTAIQTAIAQTELALPTNTPTFEPTNTDTPEPTVTYTPTVAPSPTPDVRVIDIDPRKLLLEKGELPEDASYYLPNSSWISPHHNNEVVMGLTAEKAKKYLNDTGRIDGWWVSYLRGSPTILAPEEVGDNIMLFRTAAGAQLLVNKYGNCAEDRNNDLTTINVDFTIGDASIVCKWEEIQPSGKKRVQYIIQFSYRNVAHNMYVWGWEEETTVQHLQTIADIALEKLKEQPLSDTVTYEQ